MSELFYSLRYFIASSHEHGIRNNGEQFSNKRQSTPNVSNDFQCHLMICWNLLERQFKNCLQIRQINKDKYWQESGPLIILQRSTLNGENRNGLLITRVTKAISDNVKRVHGATSVDAPLIYFHIHGTVKTRE